MADLRGRAAPPDARGPPGPAALSGPCDVCGAATIEVHCKIMCRSCGYTRDCSDP